jgi:hypothetical protein
MSDPVLAEDGQGQQIAKYFNQFGSDHKKPEIHYQIHPSGKDTNVIQVNIRDYLTAAGFKNIIYATPPDFNIKMQPSMLGYSLEGEGTMQLTCDDDRLDNVRKIISIGHIGTDFQQLGFAPRDATATLTARDINIKYRREPRTNDDFGSLLLDDTVETQIDDLFLFAEIQGNDAARPGFRFGSHLINYSEHSHMSGRNAKRLSLAVELDGISRQVQQSFVQTLDPFRAIIERGDIAPFDKKFSEAKHIRLNLDADYLNLFNDVFPMSFDHINAEVEADGVRYPSAGRLNIRSEKIFMLADPYFYGILAIYYRDQHISASFSGATLSKYLMGMAGKKTSSSEKTILSDLEIDASNEHGSISAKGGVEYRRGLSVPYRIEMKVSASHFDRVIDAVKREDRYMFAREYYLNQLKVLRRTAIMEKDGTARWNFRLDRADHLSVNGKSVPPGDFLGFGYKLNAQIDADAHKRPPDVEIRRKPEAARKPLPKIQ